MMSLLILLACGHAGADARDIATAILEGRLEDEIGLAMLTDVLAERGEL